MVNGVRTVANGRVAHGLLIQSVDDLEGSAVDEPAFGRPDVACQHHFYAVSLA